MFNPRKILVASPGAQKGSKCGGLGYFGTFWDIELFPFIRFCWKLPNSKITWIYIWNSNIWPWGNSGGWTPGCFRGKKTPLLGLICYFCPKFDILVNKGVLNSAKVKFMHHLSWNGIIWLFCLDILHQARGLDGQNSSNQLKNINEGIRRATI